MIRNQGKFLWDKIMKSQQDLDKITKFLNFTKPSKIKMFLLHKNMNYIGVKTLKAKIIIVILFIWIHKT
jgi:hypothetical protein